MDPAVRAQPNLPLADERVDRLTRALAYAAEQQTATREVLETIGRSALGLKPVFETVVRHAVRLGAAAHSVGREATAAAGRVEHSRFRRRLPLGG